MPDLTDIKTKLDAIQKHLDHSLAASQKFTDYPNKYSVISHLRDAQHILVRTRSNLRTILAAPSSAAPASTQAKKQATPAKSKINWIWCRRCREYVQANQVDDHMWNVHRIDTDGRTRAMARVAAELQQRDHDLYRDD